MKVAIKSLELTAAGLISLPNLNVVKISGALAMNFLQGQFTCDVNLVTENHATLGALCNHQGRVLAIFGLFKIEPDYFCVLPKEICAAFIAHLTKFAQFSKVTLENVSNDYYCYGVLVEDGAQLETKFALSLPGTVSRYIILSNQRPSEPGSDTRLWDHINNKAGFTWIYPTSSLLATPHMLNLHQIEGAISFNKGCYVGQEIVARTHYLGKAKRKLYLADMPIKLEVPPGEPVYNNHNQEIGVIMHSLFFKDKTYFIALVPESVEQYLIVKGQALQNIMPSQ